MALQAYIDDSGDRPQQKALVLAGFIAPAEKWAAFSEKWDTALRGPKRLEYFKTAEAIKCKGQFYGWTEPERDARLRLLYSLIEDHASWFVASIVPFDDFERAMKVIPYDFPFRPYAAALMGIMGGVRDHCGMLGFNERVDFIFDDQVMEKTRILQNWDFAVSAVPPEQAALVSKTPIFRDDKDVLPLQAADLLAWLQRNWWEHQRGLADAYEPPWVPRKEIEGMTFMFDEKAIRDVLERAYASVKRELGMG